MLPVLNRKPFIKNLRKLLHIIIILVLAILGNDCQFVAND